eukprot:11652108-Alexandrium_andersonii.AAC.1
MRRSVGRLPSSLPPPPSRGSGTLWEGLDQRSLGISLMRWQLALGHRQRPRPSACSREAQRPT